MGHQLRLNGGRDVRKFIRVSLAQSRTLLISFLTIPSSAGDVIKYGGAFSPSTTKYNK